MILLVVIEIWQNYDATVLRVLYFSCFFSLVTTSRVQV
jgi:hypothetical protein